MQDLRINLFSFFLILVMSVGVTSSGLTQNSFEIILEGEGESFVSIAHIIESSNGDYIGIYNLKLFVDTLIRWDVGLINITTEGDTSTQIFSIEDSLMYFTKIIQVSEEPIKYFASALCYPAGDDEWKNELFYLLDENFEVIWKKRFALSQNRFVTSFSDILHLYDGSYLLARRPSNVEDYMYIFHLSQEGDSLDFREYEGDSAGKIMALTYSPDSASYWLHTHLAHYDPLGPESQVIVLNEDLEQTKVMYYPRWFSENYYAKVLPNNKLVASGSYMDFDNHYLGTYILDSNLNVLHEDFLTHTDTSFAATSKCVDYYYPDQIFVGGTHNRSLWGEIPTWFVLAKYNQELDLIYERYIGGDANYWMYNITATSDSGVIVSGTRYDYDEAVTKKKAIIIKLNPEGVLVGNNEAKQPVRISKAIIYPNPGSNNLTLRTSMENSTFILYDIKGNEVLRKRINQLISNYNTDQLSAGFYTWIISDKKQILETGKWLKK